MICKRCKTEKGSEFYSKDTTCKECRKSLVRKNRAENADHYRAYDRWRYQNDPRVKERHLRYQLTEAGKNSLKKSKDRWQKENPVKRAANVILGNAVRDGKIKKPAFCSNCKSTGRIHGHHDDYSRPLEVRWLCAACHHQWHEKHGEAKNGRMTQ